MLLNIGPKADGTIPEIMEKRLIDIGTWLEKNGEAIYGTRMNRISKSKNIKFTLSSDRKALYAFINNIPQNKLIIKDVDPEESGNIHFGEN